MMDGDVFGDAPPPTLETMMGDATYDDDDAYDEGGDNAEDVMGDDFFSAQSTKGTASTGSTAFKPHPPKANQRSGRRRAANASANALLDSLNSVSAMSQGGPDEGDAILFADDDGSVSSADLSAHSDVGSSTAAGSRAIANKVRYLSRKNRELTAFLNGEKARNSQLTKKVGELEYTIMKLERNVARLKRGKEVAEMNAGRDGSDGSAGLARRMTSQSRGDGRGTTADGEQMQHPLSEAEMKKVHEYRTEIATLRKEIQRAHRALELELGDDAPINLILQGESNWQGRAQEITRLKAKVSELQTQLRGSTSRAPSSLSSTQRRSGGGVEDKGRKAIREMEEKRKRSHEELKEEHEALKMELKTTKEKYDACRSRNRTLGKELKGYREQMKAQAHSSSLSKEAEEGLRHEIDALQHEVSSLRAQAAKSKKRVRKIAGPSDTGQADERSLEALKQLTQTCEHQAQLIEDLQAQLELALQDRDSRVNNDDGDTHSRSHASNNQPVSRHRSRSRPRSSKTSLLDDVRAVQQKRALSAGNTPSDNGMLQALTVEKDKYKELCAVLTAQVESMQRTQDVVQPLDVGELEAYSEYELRQIVQDKHDEAAVFKRRLDKALASHREQMELLQSMMEKMKTVFSAAVQKISLRQ